MAVAAPAGVEDVGSLRTQLQSWSAAGLPTAPAWLDEVPLVGSRLSATWNAWTADLSAMAAFFRPYFGVIAENGLNLLLAIAGGGVVVVAIRNFFVKTPGYERV